MSQDSNFRERKAKVVVVDNSGAARSQLTEVIRSLGFNDVTGMPTLKDALAHLETENVDWLLMPLAADQEENALHLLKLATEVSRLKGLRISLLLEESETYVLDDAFALGMLSWHKKPFTKDILAQSFMDLFQRYEESQWQSAQVAATYLREYLKESKQFEEMLAFEKDLLRIFPSDSKLLFHMADALSNLGKNGQALATLKQLQLIEPDWADKIKEAEKRYTAKDDAKSDSSPEDLNFLNLKHVVVIDPDEDLQKNMSETFKALGVEEIYCFGDGDSALKHLKAHHDPDLIVHEWRLPKVSGPLFVQRARHQGFASGPFIVSSSLVKNEDLPLLREMGVVDVVEKPFERHRLLKAVVWAIQQDRMPTEQDAMERKMRNLLRIRDLAGATEIKNQLLADKAISLGLKFLIEGEFAYHEGQFENAKRLVIESVKRTGDSIQALNLLGKTLVQLREFTTALKCFEKAQRMAPLNIERLCAMAEIQSEMGDESAARETLTEAKNVDAGSTRVKEAEVKVAVNTGNLDKAKKLMAQLEALDNVVSYINNQAIAMARCDEFEKSIEQYHKAIDSIPDNRFETKAIIIYNLALANVRDDRLDDAKAVLKECIALGKTKVSEKAKSLKKRVKEAIKKGEPMVLRGASEPQADKQAEPALLESDEKARQEQIELQQVKERSILSAIRINPGEMGCFRIYAPKKEDERVTKLMANPPRLFLRSSIEKAESNGLDRMAKKAS